jgi:hypothetical protein
MRRMECGTWRLIYLKADLVLLRERLRDRDCRFRDRGLPDHPGHVGFVVAKARPAGEQRAPNSCRRVPLNHTG